MRELGRCVLIFVVLSVVTGLAYPIAVTGLSRLLFSREAQGSMVLVGDSVVGSTLIGQNFSSQRYFHGRPSALEKPYDASNSGGSNYGPTNKNYVEQVADRIRQVRTENGMGPDAALPADLVLASGSGLDPHISLEAAVLQAPRVAKARGLSEADVKRTIAESAEGRQGQKRLNVLELNLAIDALGAK